MKCVCGYVHNEWGWGEENKKFIDITSEQNTKEFIRCVQTLSYERNGSIIDRDVYICPKCGTLKIDI